MPFGKRRNIGRIIFEAVEKFDGRAIRTLSLTQLKQIAGRAGRFGTEFAVGQATTLAQGDMGVLRRALAIPMIEVKVMVTPKSFIVHMASSGTDDAFLCIPSFLAGGHSTYNRNDRRVLDLVAEGSFLIRAPNVGHDVPELVSLLPSIVSLTDGKSGTGRR